MRAMELDDDYDEEDEIKGFLTGGTERHDYAIRNGGSDPSQSRKRILGIASTVASLIAVLYLLQRSHETSMKQPTKRHGNSTKNAADNPVSPPIEPTVKPALQPPPTMAPVVSTPESTLLYSCPKVPSIAENVATAATEHQAWYESASLSITNVSTYMESFRDTEYDNWGHSYTEVKHGMAHWKSKKFMDLKSGDYVYESACGIGMNLFMTLELLNKVKKVKNITVFGNEYFGHSADIARTIARDGWLPAGGRLGTICTADSTNLSFVPDHTFALVFTGYISPLFDPLHFDLGSTDANFAQYAVDCEERGNRRFDAAQQRQNDWYAQWVGEMIRIAKPGAPIILEQVSYPLCVAPFDWGGIDPDFWPNAIRRYNWDIDPMSIEMEADTLFKKRYHVFLRKNGKRRNP